MSEWQQEIRQRVARLALRPEREAEIVDELSQHLDDQVRERVSGGLSIDDARREALAELDVPGALADGLAETESRAALTLPPPGAPARGRWLRQLWQDVRLAVRALTRRPWFSVSVLVTLALTIGPTTAIVSVGNWLLWTPSPAVSEPGRLLVIWSGQWRDNGSMSPHGVSYANLEDLRASSRTLSGVAGWQESGVSLAAPGSAPKEVQAGFVTANFFDVLGVRLAAGRTFTPDEDTPPHGGAVVVISHALASRAFGSPEGALERSIHVNGRTMTVVGVAPRTFGGAMPTSQVDVWYLGAAYGYVNHFPAEDALRFTNRAGGLFYMFIARMAGDTRAGAAQAELDTLLPLLAHRFPEDNAGFKQARARVFQGLGPQALMRPQLNRLVRGLLIVAGVLLLLGCVNVSNLLLSEGVRQQHERAVRLALGASRGRLIRQLLTESTVLAVVGAGVGVGLAVWLKQVIQAWLLPMLAELPAPPEVPMDRLVLIITLGIALVCGIVAGVAPAWIGPRASLQTRMHGGGRALTRSSRVRTAFAAVQLALSLALVSGAVLLVGTLQHLSRVDLGFSPDQVTVQPVSLRAHGYNADRAFLYNQSLRERLEADPTFEEVALSTGFPFGYSRIQRLQTPGGTERQTTNVYAVMTTDNFPAVLGLELLHGRYFRADEVMTAAPTAGGPVVVSESLAQAFFGRTDVLGQRITIPPRTLGTPVRDVTVVGVMRDTLTRGLTEKPDFILYHPITGEEFARQTVVITRARGSLNRVNEIVERAAVDLDATLPIGKARFLTTWIDRELASTRMLAWVLSLMGGAGFLLAAVGLHGLLAQAVGERRREFGVRLAIGASAADIARLVFRQAAWTSALGVAGGLALAYWGSALVKTYLVGVSEFDPRIYALTVFGLVTVVFLAAIRPAWSATRVNPVEALRAE